MTDAPLLTPNEVADIIGGGTSPRFVLDELRRKNLRGHKLGVGWRINVVDLDVYLAAKANVSAVRKSA